MLTKVIPRKGCLWWGDPFLQVVRRRAEFVPLAGQVSQADQGLPGDRQPVPLSVGRQLQHPLVEVPGPLQMATPGLDLGQLPQGTHGDQLVAAV